MTKPDTTPPGLESTLSRANPGLSVPTPKPGDGMSEAMHRFIHWLDGCGGSGVLTKNKHGMVAGGATVNGMSFKFWERLAATGYFDVEGVRYTINDRGKAYVAAHPLAQAFQGTRHGQVARHPGLDEED